MIISYQEFRPSPALQPYVENYWLQVFDGMATEESPQQVCLPLGMAQIIVHTHAQDCFGYFDNTWQRLPDAFFVGVYKDAVTWKTMGHSVCFGMNLKPECLLHLFQVPASVLFNDYTDISNFLNRKINTLAERMYGISDAAELIRISEAYLTSRLKHIAAERSYVTEATQLIRQAKGNISVEDLCRNLYVSERQLQRSFKDALGTGPKTYTRIIRFRNAYQHVKQAKHEKVSWASISYDFGYSDQAHFIRDFKEFSGTVPSLLIEDDCQFYQLSTGTLG